MSQLTLDSSKSARRFVTCTRGESFLNEGPKVTIDGLVPWVVPGESTKCLGGWAGPCNANWFGLESTMVHNNSWQQLLQSSFLGDVLVEIWINFLWPSGNWEWHACLSLTLTVVHFLAKILVFLSGSGPVSSGHDPLESGIQGIVLSVHPYPNLAWQVLKYTIILLKTHVQAVIGYFNCLEWTGIHRHYACLMA